MKGTPSFDNPIVDKCKDSKTNSARFLCICIFVACYNSMLKRKEISGRLPAYKTMYGIYWAFWNIFHGATDKLLLIISDTELCHFEMAL